MGVTGGYALGRLPLAAAAALDPAVWADLGASDLDLSAADLDSAARVWGWLCGVDSASSAQDADRVRREVCSDGGLLVALLALPASEFLHWFRCAAWEDFDSTERTGCDAWAWGALRRAWERCEALGAMSTQCGLTGPA